ncbi:MAG TPA: Uma2 family endonuclease [Thermoanaerobaculia bacterium]|nr:Uma2 family endonuclease [Thermoanaerobaculia bacterium]
MSLPEPSLLTPEEYLDIERKSEIRSEYINGRMIAMWGASWRHSIVSGNLFRELSSQLRGKACEAHTNDLRVKVSPTGMYTYPDIVALCGEAELEDEHLDTLLNPSVIIEVLSDSTEAYDRGEKFAHYRRIDSLREYVLVSQNKIRIELFRRDADQWIFSEVTGPDAVLHLESIDCHVAVSTIYEKVEFETK